MKLKTMFICFVVLVFTLTGCKSSVGVIPKPSTETIKEVTITETIRDTVYGVKADSSFYKAYIECVNGKPVLKETKSNPGKNLNAPKVDLHGNNLNVNCKTEAYELFHKWKETYIKENLAKTIQVPYAVPTPLSTFKVVQLWFGRLFMFLILLFGVTVFLRYKKII